VSKLTRRAGGVELVTDRHGPETFDHVIMATHSDQALQLLSDPTRAEREVLGAITYQPNLAVLHTDTRLLPRNRRAWASWNYHRVEGSESQATLTYHLNRLQSITSRQEFCVTLNRPDAIEPGTILASIEYAHPVFDTAAVRAQQRHDDISGHDGLWYCGAYWRYGFHEDGVQSALRVCRTFGVTL
jgi:predicted NAD/FAD-binding protein